MWFKYNSDKLSGCGDIGFSETYGRAGPGQTEIKLFLGLLETHKSCRFSKFLGKSKIY